jgi:hypothetical protein
MSKCKYCGTEIVWMKDGRKNVPVEVDGAKHECEEFKNTARSYKELKPTDIDPEVLKQYQENMKKKLKK